jgi:hypothetical protein
MKSFVKVAVSGLLWLSFSAVMFGDTLYLGQSYNVELGGQFMGYLTSNPTNELTMYCVDYLNDLASPAPVNVNTLADLSDTRYGTTATGSFANPDSASIGLTAMQRYVLAAWLTTQYQLVPSPPPATVTFNDNIQGAIWDLLNVNGQAFTDGGDIAAAKTWYSSLSAPALAAFQNEIVIYTPIGVATDNNLVFGSAGNRYQTAGSQQDSQEQIGVVPEPATLALLGAGLLAIGLFRKHRKA